MPCNGVAVATAQINADLKTLKSVFTATQIADIMSATLDQRINVYHFTDTRLILMTGGTVININGTRLTVSSDDLTTQAVESAFKTLMGIAAQAKTLRALQALGSLGKTQRVENGAIVGVIEL